MDLLKHCSRCKEDWPADAEFFYADSTSKDGLFYCCKACHAQLRKTPDPRHKVKPPPAPRATDALAQFRWIHSTQTAASTASQTATP